jgi:formylglycine-generating enzyme required for sulfatase activity
VRSISTLILLLVAMGASASERGAGAKAFRDALKSGGEGPELIRLPAGRFAMGSPDGEADRIESEGPVTEHRMRPFAIGRSEVTREEFERFVAASGYATEAERDVPVPLFDGGTGCMAYRGGAKIRWTAGTSWRNPGFEQTGAHPAVCVSLDDARAYAAWLTRETGHAYRLPTEAEFEYAQRAGTNGAWWWGELAAMCKSANGADADFLREFPERRPSTATCADGFVFTNPVGSFPANAFGLRGMAGNAAEWTSGCAFNEAKEAPTPARELPDDDTCLGHGVRGGSWLGRPAWLRSAYHDTFPDHFRMADIGFRVVRELKDDAK